MMGKHRPEWSVVRESQWAVGSQGKWLTLLGCVGSGRLLEGCAIKAGNRKMRRGQPSAEQESAFLAEDTGYPQAWKQEFGPRDSQHMWLPHGPPKWSVSILYPEGSFGNTNLATLSPPQCLSTLGIKSESFAECDVAPLSLQPQSLATLLPPRVHTPHIPVG